MQISQRDEICEAKNVVWVIEKVVVSGPRKVIKVHDDVEEEAFAASKSKEEYNFAWNDDGENRNKLGRKWHVLGTYKLRPSDWFNLIFYFPTHDRFNYHLKHQGSTRLGVLIRPVWLWHHFHLVYPWLDLNPWPSNCEPSSQLSLRTRHRESSHQYTIDCTGI